MNIKTFTKISALAILGLSLSGTADAASKEEKLARKSGCFKCHAIKKKKDGPSYTEIAEKYRGKPEAEEKLYEHATTEPKVKIEDREETHKTLKTDDPEEIKAVIRWILSH